VFKIFTRPRRFHARVARMTSDLYKCFKLDWTITVGSHLNVVLRIGRSNVSVFAWWIRVRHDETGRRETKHYEIQIYNDYLQVNSKNIQRSVLWRTESLTRSRVHRLKSPFSATRLIWTRSFHSWYFWSGKPLNHKFIRT
jgi:hypothetical protein